MAAAVLVLSACGAMQPGPKTDPGHVELDRRDHPFSLNAAGVAVPLGWENWTFGPLKPQTVYQTRLDPLAGQVVVHAHAERSASALLLSLAPAVTGLRTVRWSWRAAGLIEGADVGDAAHEDSPVRLILGFQGDHSKLSFRDLMFEERVKLLSGQDLPYATLMYVWSNNRPLESIVPNPHTARIRMLVIENGAADVGVWRSYQRDIVADFRLAYGEDPGPLVTVGIMTDTDNTATIIDADYGDIRLEAAAPSAPLTRNAPSSP